MGTGKIICISLLFASIASTAFSKNDNDSLGLEGDNLDLYGVLELFKKSENPEAFEKALNSENNEVNNLDLNKDNETDYIRVIDHSEKDAHALILQVPVNENEVQDVAVIELEKKGNEDADVQIVGDEELYGKDYIVEPAEESSATPATKVNVYVNVWAWPVVHHIYGPKYVIWVSPWHWRYYPVWWKPWKPVFWHVHHKRVLRYHHAYCHRVYAHRVVAAHTVYHTHRIASKTVVARRTPAGKSAVASPGRKAGKQAKGQQKAVRKNNPQKAGKQKNRAQKAGGPQRSGKGGKGRR